MNLPQYYYPYQAYYNSFYPSVKETVMPLEQYYSVPNLPKVRKLKKKHSRPKTRVRTNQSLSSNGSSSNSNGIDNGNSNQNSTPNANGNGNNVILTEEELWLKREEILKEKFVAHSGTDLM